MTDDERDWRKAERAQIWRPGDGEVLQGTYVHSRARSGSYGEYFLHVVRTEAGLFSVSGSVISALLEDAGVVSGDLVRVVFLGKKSTATGKREYKDFELYIAESVETK